MFIQLLLYFLAGLIIDALYAAHTKVIANKKAFLAAGLGMLIAIIDITVFAAITDRLVNDDLTTGIFNIISFAIGTGVGNYIAVIMPIEK